MLLTSNENNCIAALLTSPEQCPSDNRIAASPAPPEQYPNNNTVFDGLDVELFFATEILKLKSLHYGYWSPTQALTVENLRTAQARYTETLLELMPEGIQTILDVGAGIGDNALALAAKGYTVSAISPDKNHKRYYIDTKRSVPFFNVRFEDFSFDGQFDLILMSESHNYLQTDLALRQCEKYLRPGGYLLVSGMFLLPDGSGLDGILHTERGYVSRAAAHRLDIVRRADITECVLPTLALAHDAYENYCVPFMQLVEHYVNSSAPYKAKLLRLFFRKQVRELRDLQTFYEQRLDPKLFKDRGRYIRLLFQASA
jgi:MPBQ/MSBQ methyltransferase